MKAYTNKSRKCRATRHPTSKGNKNPTVSPSSISLGANEKNILLHLKKYPNNRFNTKGYARELGKAKTTVTDAINRLLFKELISKPNYGNYVITNKGLNVLELRNEGVGLSRKGCRDAVQNLSTHFTKYSFILKDKKNLSESLLKQLSPNHVKVNDKFKNTLIYHMYFDDVTITIFSKKVIIQINDIINNNLEEMELERLGIVTKYIEKLLSIGLEGDTLTLDNSHYARVEGFLANFLTKIDKKYSLDLGNGRLLWIDNSEDHLEDETNDLKTRERVDSFLDDTIKCDYLISDIGTDLEQLKQITSNLVKLEVSRNFPTPKISQNKIERAYYFG